ncbi:MAG: hypothetical protein LAO18_08990 [Acidobacteriia bacterium]|nr:hypothetical protein [Terriglobia bacterium]
MTEGRPAPGRRTPDVGRGTLKIWAITRSFPNGAPLPVKAWLVGRGASNQISTQGFGDTKPVAPNTKPDGSDDLDGRQKNRRVQITLKK